jgi:hypothetical protein
MNTQTEMIVENLYRVPESGKAEILDGELRVLDEDDAEDIALARAIEEGVGSATVSRDEIFVVLDGEQCK